MKRILLSSFLLSLIIVSGCGSEKTAETEAAAVPAGMIALDLSQYEGVGLPLIVNVPDEATGKGIPEVMDGPTGGTQVKVGKDFNIEILPGGSGIAEKKAALSNDDVFKATYIVDEPNALLYKLSIDDAGITQYHFYAFITAGTLTYEVVDVQGEEDFSDSSIKKMLESAKAIKEKPKAS